VPIASRAAGAGSAAGAAETERWKYTLVVPEIGPRVGSQQVDRAAHPWKKTHVCDTRHISEIRGEGKYERAKVTFDPPMLPIEIDSPFLSVDEVARRA
jgi:hypothetical protein